MWHTVSSSISDHLWYKLGCAVGTNANACKVLVHCHFHHACMVWGEYSRAIFRDAPLKVYWNSESRNPSTQPWPSRGHYCCSSSFRCVNSVIAVLDPWPVSEEENSNSWRNWVSAAECPWRHWFAKNPHRSMTQKAKKFKRPYGLKISLGTKWKH